MPAEEQTMSVNRIILVGNVGQVHGLQQGSKSAYCRFGLATSRGSGDNKETQWFNCVVFGKQAEIFDKYCNKGQLLYCEGRIQTSEYQGKKDFSVIVEVFRMLGGRPKKDEQDQRPEYEDNPPF
jgi:single-strand DNA-binding protein